MNGFEVYCTILALSNHFFSSYDYIKYGPKPVKFETYQKKSEADKYKYEKLASKYTTREELEHFLIANYVLSEKRCWLGELVGKDAENRYLDWKKRVDSMQYNTVSQVKKLVEVHQNFNNLFKSSPGQHPEVLKAYLKKELSLETFIVLNLCVNFFPRLCKDLGDDIVWMNTKIKCEKYQVFLQRLGINLDVFKQAIRKAILDVVEPLAEIPIQNSVTK